MSEVKRVLVLAVGWLLVGSVTARAQIRPMPVTCVHQGSGQDIQVGPGTGQLPNLAAVDWNNLQAGDTVRIFWRAQPYAEKFLLKGSGTAAQPIRVCGVRDPATGQLPTITGVNAVSRPDLDFPPPSPQWGTLEDTGVVVIWNQDYNLEPSHIAIEGLRILGGQQDVPGQPGTPNYYQSTLYGQRRYDDGAACIRVQDGDDIVIRGNELFECAMGVFTLSRDFNRASLIERLLIEGNYFHDNGLIGSDTKHDLYVQVVEPVYQYNFFGRNKAGALGSNLKDRSVGSIIRYNWFETAYRIMDLVEPEDYFCYVFESYLVGSQYCDHLRPGGAPDPATLAFVRANEAKFQHAYVYGNLIDYRRSITGVSALVHYGADNVPEMMRQGTLHFFHNTVMVRADRSVQWRLRFFDQVEVSPNPRPASQIHVFGNVFWGEAETPGQPMSYTSISRYTGDQITLGANVIFTGWNIDDLGQGGLGPGTVTGSANMIATPTRPVTPFGFQPLPGTPVIDGAPALPPEVVPLAPLSYQYQHHARGVPRLQAYAGPDFGALELPDDVIFKDGF